MKGQNSSSDMPATKGTVERNGPMKRPMKIVRPPWLGQVASLDLSHHDITLPELETLLASPHLGRLRRLLLRSVALTPDGVEALARSPVLRQLRHLDPSITPTHPAFSRQI